MPTKIDIEQIKRAARNSIPLSIKTFTLPHETEEYLERLLAIFLEEFGQDQIRDRIAYCLKELAVNAKKANTKRVFFKEMDLDILDKQDYTEGMKDFKRASERCVAGSKLRSESISSPNSSILMGLEALGGKISKIPPRRLKLPATSTTSSG